MTNAMTPQGAALEGQTCHRHHFFFFRSAHTPHLLRACCCALTRAVPAAARFTGYIPAILTGGSNAKIIPAIEGLVYPLFGNAPEAVSEHGPYKAREAESRRSLE